MSALPYDATPPPSPPHPSEEMAVDPAIPDALDRPLDEFQPAVPAHVADLMSRMSHGKVYLLEDSPAVIHLDGEARAMRDPRIAALAEQLDEHDPTEWLNVVSASAPSAIRHNALYLRSDLIKHLSTSKIFSWVTSMGTTVMGIEWLNDTSLHLLFPSPSASLLALTILSKAGFDPAEGDDPLLERSAHSFPPSLFAQVIAENMPSKAGEELLGESTETDGVKRRGRGGFRSGTAMDSLAESSVSAPEPAAMTFLEGVDPHARVTVRFAVEGDKQLRQDAKTSEWYKRHGRRAGKEVAETKRNSPYARSWRDEEQEVMGWTGGGEGGEGRDLARRLGRGGGQRGRGGRVASRGAATAEDLDAELVQIRGGDDSGSRRGGGGRGKGRGERRPPRGKEDLDKELDNMFSGA